MIKLIECSRDAIQGWPGFIPTSTKIEYLNALLKVGFHTLDFGSFVSPKAIPQMADTKEVLPHLELTDTKLLAIVANLRGAEEALMFEQIDFLGYPFSISETFQRRNTNSGIQSSFELVKQILKLCHESGKELVVYISMGFGNPYGDVYSKEIVYEWVAKLRGIGIRIVSLADTVGLATPSLVEEITGFVKSSFPELELGAHLHAQPNQWREKVEAAVRSGIQRIDGALKGIGGCPMANNELVGNLDTELLIPYLEQRGLLGSIDHEALQKASELANTIFHIN